MSYEDSGKLAKGHDPSEPGNGVNEELRTMFDTQRKIRRFLVVAAMVAALFMTTLAFARDGESFKGESGPTAATSRVTERVALQPFSNLPPPEHLLSFMGNEYPTVLACSTTAERDAMLEHVVLHPAGGQQESSTPVYIWPDGTGKYHPAAATEVPHEAGIYIPRGVGYYIER